MTLRKLLRYKLDRFKTFFKLLYWYVKDQLVGTYRCPKCGCWMSDPPRNYNICPNLRCFVEFGYDWPECEDDGTPWDGVDSWKEWLHVSDEEWAKIKKRYDASEEDPPE